MPAECEAAGASPHHASETADPGPPNLAASPLAKVAAATAPRTSAKADAPAEAAGVEFF